VTLCVTMEDCYEFSFYTIKRCINSPFHYSDQEKRWTEAETDTTADAMRKKASSFISRKRRGLRIIWWRKWQCIFGGVWSSLNLVMKKSFSELFWNNNKKDRRTYKWCKYFGTPLKLMQNLTNTRQIFEESCSNLTPLSPLPIFITGKKLN
jgi:hypothetical protein